MPVRTWNSASAKLSLQFTHVSSFVNRPATGSPHFGHTTYRITPPLLTALPCGCRLRILELYHPTLARLTAGILVRYRQRHSLMSEADPRFSGGASLLFFAFGGRAF